MSSKIIIKNVEPEYNGQRIDKFLSETLPEYSRSFIQKVVKDGGVLVDEKCVKSNYKLSAGQILKLNVPELVEPDIIPEDIALAILYEDDDIIVVNTAPGMAVHLAVGH